MNKSGCHRTSPFGVHDQALPGSIFVQVFVWFAYFVVNSDAWSLSQLCSRNGERPPSRAVFRALAEQHGDEPRVHWLVSAVNLTPTGEGAGRNTRGRVCSPIPNASSRLSHCLEIVASAILAEVEPRLPARRKNR